MTLDRLRLEYSTPQYGYHSKIMHLSSRLDTRDILRGMNMDSTSKAMFLLYFLEIVEIHIVTNPRKGWEFLYN